MNALRADAGGADSLGATGGRNPLLRAWRALVRAYQELESTMWGRLLLANAWPGYLFSFFLFGQLVTYVQLVQQGPSGAAGGSGALWLAEMVNRALTLAFMVLIVVLFLIRRPIKGRHANWKGGLVALVGTFLLNVLAFLRLEYPTSELALWISSAFIAVGTLFTIWSLATLGRCFGIFPEARGLVTRGPYRWVRHPVYLGELISAFGFVVEKPLPTVIAFYVAFVVFQYWRAVLEEGALSEVFPGEYGGYRARTGRLLPRWR